MKTKLRFIQAFWLSALIAIAMLGTHPVYAASASMYLSPASSNVSPSSTFSISLRENSGSEPINIVKAYLTYPTDKLSVTSVTASSAFPIVFPGSSFNSYGGGVIKITQGTTSQPPPSGDQLIATITFSVIGSSGSAAVQVDRSNSAVVSSSSNKDVLTSTSDGTYVITTAAPQPLSPPPGATSPESPSSKNPLAILNSSFKQPATIGWTTSAPSTSIVDYGTDTKYGKTTQDNSYVTNHSLVLGEASLQPNSLYHYRIKSVDKTGNVAINPDATFTTGPSGTIHHSVTAGTFQINNSGVVAFIVLSLVAIGALIMELWLKPLRKSFIRAFRHIFFHHMPVSALSKKPIELLILRSWKRFK